MFAALGLGPADPHGVAATLREIIRRPVPVPRDDGGPLARYGVLGRPGTGRGRGCPPGDPDCAPVAATLARVDPARATEAHAAASRALAAREIAAPALRAPEPEAGEITMDYVRRVVRHDLLADVVRCYTARLEQMPLESGRVLVRFTIGADGRVSDAAVVASALRDADTHACITRTLGAYVWPRSSAGATVTYPFWFSGLAPEG